MHYSQVTIKGLLEEHKAIRGHLNTVLEITGNWKNRLSSQEDMQQSANKIQDISDIRAGLRLAMGYLEDGLKKHHIHEDKVMPSLVGDL
jgi:hypothetical protein